MMQAFVYDHDRQEIGVKDGGAIRILQPAQARVLIQELHAALAVVETHTHTQHVVFSPALGLLPCMILAHNDQIALVRAHENTNFDFFRQSIYNDFVLAESPVITRKR